MLCRYPIDGIGCESSRETYVVYLVCIRVSCISILRLYFYYIKSPGCCYSWMGGCWRQLAWQQGSENLVFANSLQSGSSLKIHSFFFFFLFSPFSPSAGNDGLFPDRLEIDWRMQFTVFHGNSTLQQQQRRSSHKHIDHIDSINQTKFLFIEIKGKKKLGDAVQLSRRKAKKEMCSWQNGMKSDGTNRRKAKRKNLAEDERERLEDEEDYTNKNTHSSRES